MFSFFYKHRKVVAKNVQGLYDTFLKRRRQLLRLSILSFSIAFLALAIVGLKLFYPFHMVIGVSIYILSFIPLVRSIYLSKQTWKAYRAYSWSTSFFKKERMRLVFVGVFIITIISFFWLRPLNDRPFVSLTDEQLVQQIVDDRYLSVTAMDYLETSGNELVSLLNIGREDMNLNEDVSIAFATFLEATAFSESLTESHRYFASIPYGLWDERVSSFLISYSLYVKKYEIVHRIMSAVSGDERLKKILNQQISELGRDDVYSEMVNRFYEPKTRLRLTGGYFYMQIFAQPDEKNDPAFALLYSKAAGSYSYLSSNFASTLLHTGEVVTDNLEQNMFDAWFPIQKTVATAMGRAIITTRGKSGFITPQQAFAMEEVMKPGDIMLQRRNWHVSNVGIPGFWTHSALYTGDLPTMDNYFASEFPYLGHDSMSSYLADNLPDVYRRYIEPDKDGNPRSVIEAIEPGVVLQSLPVSADADFVVTLRVGISKYNTLLAILRAFENFGKPYDFDFDFDTRDAIVCSELVYDAYLPRPPEKKGLYFEISMVSGRKVVSPLDMANKFVVEYGTSEQLLTFVYLLRGNEDTQEATVGTEADFLESVNWSKFSFMQKFEN
jgi:hypothetical protein